jgi:hypothetical protein
LQDNTLGMLGILLCMIWNDIWFLYKILH